MLLSHATQVAYWLSDAKRAKRRVLLKAISDAMEAAVARHIRRNEAATRCQAAFRAHFQFEWYRQYVAVAAIPPQCNAIFLYAAWVGHCSRVARW